MVSAGGAAAPAPLGDGDALAGRRGTAKQLAEVHNVRELDRRERDCSTAAFMSRGSIVVGLFSIFKGKPSEPPKPTPAAPPPPRPPVPTPPPPVVDPIEADKKLKDDLGYVSLRLLANDHSELFDAVSAAVKDPSSNGSTARLQISRDPIVSRTLDAVRKDHAAGFVEDQGTLFDLKGLGNHLLTLDDPDSQLVGRRIAEAFENPKKALGYEMRRYYITCYSEELDDIRAQHEAHARAEQERVWREKEQRLIANEIQFLQDHENKRIAIPYTRMSQHSSRWSVVYSRIGGTLTDKERFLWVLHKVMAGAIDNEDPGPLQTTLISILWGDGKGRADWTLDPNYTGDRAAEMKSELQRIYEPLTIAEIYEEWAPWTIEYIKDYPERPLSIWAAKALGIRASGGWATPQ